MRRRGRFSYLIVARYLRWLLAALVGVPMLYWAWLQFDDRTIAGLLVRSQRLPRTATPQRELERIAQAWAAKQLSIVTGPHLTRATHAELGAHLDASRIAPQVQRLGRSGNPLIDLWVIFDAAGSGREVPWAPTVDRLALGRYVRAVRNLVERPPVAGATDEAGWSIAGVPGETFDTISAVSAIERALRQDRAQLEIAMRQVPPPKAIAIGSPDAIIYDEGHEGELDTSFGDDGVDLRRMRAAEPRHWLPSQGCEPMEPPYERFCQGPRKVAMPFGEDAELAEALELGSVPAVGRLLSVGPRPEWVRAAGGPVAQHRDLLYPVPSGTLWRRFGFVRKPPFENLLHRGIDIGRPSGSPIVVSNRGIVAYSDNGVRGYGNLLVVVHDDGSVTFSAHCRAIYVFAGQRVRRGQIVGEVGETGLARGAHVHWEYHIHGKPEDPWSKFAARPTRAGRQ